METTLTNPEKTPKTRRRRTALWAAAAVAVAAGATATGSLAYADTAEPESTSYVDGEGEWTDDFGDHLEEIGHLCDQDTTDGLECSKSSVDSDTVLLWQAILAAEGYLDVEHVNGDFGPETTKATQDYQNGHCLEVDGIVGEETWTKADDKLGLEDPGGEVVFYAAGAEEDQDCTGEDIEGGYIYFGRSKADLAYQFTYMAPAGPDGKPGQELANASGAERIEHHELTITLEPR
ncbi:MAG: peptidoglycan-binding domain-containing protein [Stackebrandtia sp.]